VGPTSCRPRGRYRRRRPRRPGTATHDLIQSRIKDRGAAFVGCSACSRPAEALQACDPAVPADVHGQIILPGRTSTSS
jgi:hypothetical protein